LKTTNTYFKGKTSLKYLLLMLITLVVADGLISQFLVRYGLGREGNQFLSTLINNESFLILKIAGALLGAFILWDINKKHPKVANIVTLVFILIYTGIVYWNLSIYFTNQI